MASRWVTLFHGSIPEVITLRVSCEASGIPTDVPDMSLLEWDPTIRGGDIFAVDLRVPSDRLDEARGLLPATRPDRGGLEKLGSRVRWCIAFVVTAPIGIWLGIRYLAATQELPEKPAEHGWTVASFWICVALVTAVLLRGSLVLLLH